MEWGNEVSKQGFRFSRGHNHEKKKKKRETKTKNKETNAKEVSPRHYYLIFSKKSKETLVRKTDLIMETGNGSRASGLNHSIFTAWKGALELMMPLEGLSNVDRDRG